MSTCTKWVVRLVITCENWSTMVDYECTQSADEGSNQCSEWADEGSNECGEWGKKCRWYKPWNCVAEWFCKAFAWVVKAVCIIFSWGLTLACEAWDWVRCALLAIAQALANLLGGCRHARRKVDRVFVLMLENRSFDHMYAFSGITGVGIDGNPTALDGAGPGDTNFDPTTNRCRSTTPPSSR